jgi:sarcosine oxidase subunit alpha
LEKGDFIGRRSLIRDQNVGGMRPKVVGLLPVDTSYQAPDGTPLTDGTTPSGDVNVVGYVTQCVYSPTLKRSIAMAVLDDGLKKLGQVVTMYAIDGQMPAEITRPGFIDPKGKRMRG